MKPIILAVCLFSAIALSVAGSIPESPLPPSFQINNFDSERTVHFFVLMVPDTTVQALRRARQEEEAAETLTETGAYVGQIISGVLGGDVRPIFAGSASFIDEPDVQQGVSTILANVAPSVNNILKQWFNRVQTALGITSTPAPGTVLANGTRVRPSNGQVVINQGQGGQQLTSQQQQYAQSQQVEYVNAGSNVLSGNNLYQTTTVEPLPLLKLKPSDEDNEEESDNLRKV